MNEAAVREKIRELNDIVNASPLMGEKKDSTAEGVYRPEAPSAGCDTTDCLDLLRLQVKYLLFDLEATRRENRYLRRMLQTRHERNHDEDSDSDWRNWQVPPTI